MPPSGGRGGSWRWDDFGGAVMALGIDMPGFGGKKGEQGWQDEVAGEEAQEQATTGDDAEFSSAAEVGENGDKKCASGTEAGGVNGSGNVLKDPDPDATGTGSSS